MGNIHQGSARGLSVVDTGDFLQLRNTSTRKLKILEIRWWQTSDITLAMSDILITVGTTGAAGAAVAERQYDSIDTASAAALVSLATTDVAASGVIPQIGVGWNILQEGIWRPTPKIQLPMEPSQTLGVALAATDTLTMGWNITWEENAD